LNLGLRCRRREAWVQVACFAPIQHISPHAKTRPLEGFLRIMVILLVIIHVIVCLFLIGVVLLQQGKSADLAGAFGGQGSQTAFGPRGAANVLTRLTTWSAIIFMLTSIGLTVVMSRANTSRSVLSGTPSSESAPAKK
jgi:preprotein translocase subunit SecG